LGGWEGTSAKKLFLSFAISMNGVNQKRELIISFMEASNS